MPYNDPAKRRANDARPEKRAKAAEWARAYRQAGLEKKRDPKKLNASRKRWIANNPEKHQAAVLRRQLRYLYGMSVEEYEQLLLSQGGLCAICSRPPRGKMKRLFVDHDHVTGARRGLVCGPCNSILGFARDEAATLLAAVSYLKRYGRG